MLPSAHRAARAVQMRSPSGGPTQQPSITVIRASGATTTKYDVAMDLMLQPSDVVQVVSLFPPFLELKSDQFGAPGERNAESDIRTGAAMPRSEAAIEAARPRRKQRTQRFAFRFAEYLVSEAPCSLRP
jgi:hypothetical protein